MSQVAYVTDAYVQVKRLLADIQERRFAVRIASGLTASQAQEERKAMLEVVNTLIHELLQERNAKQLAADNMSHLYRALVDLIRVKNALLNDASLDEIQTMLEDADVEISQAQPSKAKSR